MRTATHLLTLSAALAVFGCAQPGQRPSLGQAPTPTAAKPATPEAAPDAAKASPAPGTADTKAAAESATPLPGQDLSAQTLYDFLVAEIAGQRGELKLSSQAYIALAKQTRDPRVARRATEVAVYAKDAQAALEAAKLWSTLEPGSVKALQAVAGLLVTRGKLAEAEPYLRRLISFESIKIGAGFLQLHTLLAQQPDKAAVLKLTQDLAAPYPNLAEARLAVSQAALDAKQYDLALSEVRAAAKLWPGWEAAALHEARLLERQDPARAADFLRAFLENYPKEREVRLSYAKLLASQKNYGEARAQFERLTTDFPDNPDMFLAVGLLAMQVEDWPAAERYLQKSLELGYADANAIRLYLGQIAEEREQYPVALRWYGEVLSGQHFLSARLRQAGVLAKQGKLDEARKYLQALPVKGDDEKVKVVQTESLLLRDAKQYQAAFDLLSNALGKSPETAELLYDRAMVAEKLDRLDLLEQDLRKLIELKPDYAHAYNALGYTLADRSIRLDEAQKLVQKALELSPDDPFILDSLGWVHYRRGEIGQAVRVLQQAYKLQPDPEIAAHLGEVLWVQGNTEEAKRVWRSTLKENPKNEALLDVMQKFVR